MSLDRFQNPDAGDNNRFRDYGDEPRERRAKEELAKVDFKNFPYAIKYRLDTTVKGDGTIQHDLYNASEHLSRWVANARDKATRDALIKLGWTPPEDK